MLYFFSFYNYFFVFLLKVYQSIRTFLYNQYYNLYLGFFVLIDSYTFLVFTIIFLFFYKY